MTGTAMRDYLAPYLPVLIDAAIKGTALLLLAGAATLLMRKASAAGRQLVWFLAMIGLLVLPVLSAALPAWQVLPGWARVDAPAAKPAPVAAVPEPPPPALLGSHRHAPDTYDAPAGAAVPVSAMPDEPVAAHPPLAAKPAAAPAGAPGRSWSALLPWTPAAWLTGAVLSLAPLLLGRLSLWRLRRAARPIDDPAWQAGLAQAAAVLDLKRPVRLLTGDRRTMPMIWGTLRPVLLLPADAAHWSPPRLQVVLMHELAHAKRSDCLMRLLAHLACAAYWFNPLAWLAFRRLQSEAEVACDDLVLASGHKASDYAEHLLDIASGLKSGMLAAYSSIAMARPSKLEGRLLAILDDRRNRRAMTGGLILLAAVLLAGLVVPLSLLKAAGDDQATTYSRKFRVVVLDIVHRSVGLDLANGFVPVVELTGSVDETGKSTVGAKGAVSEIEYRYLRTTKAGDEYEITRRFPADTAKAITVKKTVVYAGKRLIVFEDEADQVLFVSPEDYERMEAAKSAGGATRPASQATTQPAATEPAAATRLTDDEQAQWVARIVAADNHNLVSFEYGPQLMALDPQEALAIAQAAWPRIAKQEVKTAVLKAFAFGRHPDVVQVLNLGMTDADPEVRRYATTYLRPIAMRTFDGPADEYQAWYAQFADKPVAEIIRTGYEHLAEQLKAMPADKGVELLRKISDDFGATGSKTTYPEKHQLALDAGVPEILAGWLRQSTTSPQAVTETIHMLQMISPPRAFLDREIVPLTAASQPAAVQAAAREMLGAVALDSDAQSPQRLVVRLLDQIRSGNPDRGVIWAVARKLAELGDPQAIPVMIGVIDADNSYDTYYGVGYFGLGMGKLGKLTGVQFSIYHDGPWWRRWWAANKSRFPQEAQRVPIPDLPKTAAGKQYVPYPDNLDTHEGRAAFLRQRVAAGDRDFGALAQLFADAKDPRGIPELIGLMATPNDPQAVYHVGYSGLQHLTGVPYDPSQDAPWWRQWWATNRTRFPEAAGIDIPDLSKEAKTGQLAASRPATRLAVPSVELPRPGEELAGLWSGDAQIVVDWCKQKRLPVSVTILADGSVTGTVGDATLREAKVESNRGEIGRALNLATDFIIRGKLDGAIVAAEDIKRDAVMVPFNLVGGQIKGGVNSSGSKLGGKESMILAAGGMVLSKSQPEPATQPATRETVVTQTYDIDDLVVEMADSSPPLLWSFATGSAAMQKADESAKAQLARANDVVKAILAGVDADSWTIPGARISTVNDSLTVTQTAANQEKIAKLLQGIRQARGGKVNIETCFLGPGKQVDGEVAALMHKSGREVGNLGGVEARVLGEGEAQAIVARVANSPDGRSLTSPRLTLFHNQKACVSVAKQTVLSLAIVPGAGARVPMVFQAGAWVGVQPVIAPDGHHVTLTLDAAWTNLDSGDAEPLTSLGQVKGTVLLADGEWLLARMPIGQSKVTGAKETAGAEGAKDYQVVQSEPKPTGEFVYFLLKPTILAQAANEKAAARP